jgi:hypothetical protein
MVIVEEAGQDGIEWCWEGVLGRGVGKGFAQIVGVVDGCFFA